MPSSTHSLWQCQHFNTVCRAWRVPSLLACHSIMRRQCMRRYTVLTRRSTQISMGTAFDGIYAAATLVVFNTVCLCVCMAAQVTGGECCTYFIETRKDKGCRYGECGRVHGCSRCGNVQDHAHRNNCNVWRVACIDRVYFTSMYV